jgi:hypothetical protein
VNYNNLLDKPFLGSLGFLGYLLNDLSVLIIPKNTFFEVSFFTEYLIGPIFQSREKGIIKKYD